MVLSHKKLKQKLRSLVSSSLTPAPSADAAATAVSGDVDVKQELQAVRDLLTSKTNKPKRPKRPKRRKSDDTSENVDTDKKRKREDSDGEVEGEEKEVRRNKKKEKAEKYNENMKEKRKKLKKLKQKKLEKREKKKIADEVKVEETAEKPVAEAMEVDESEFDPKKIYVGGIPYYSSEEDILSFFEGCGTVTEVDCMYFPETGKFRGIAMLTFKTEAAAKRALALDGADMGGFYLKIQPYKASRTQKTDFAPEIVDGYNRIYIGNLAWDVTEDDLKKLFSECTVSSIRFGMDKETGEFKGYAHVDFADSASLEVALKLDQSEVRYRPVKIRCAVPTKSVVKKVKEEATDGKSKRNKRRECFTCGVWGHLASACLQKPTSEGGSSDNVDTSLSSKLTAKKAEDPSTNIKTTRRTCYVCGVPGHISSACPKNATVGTSSVEEVETSLSTKPTTIKVEDGVSTENKKVKRQTCYECGIPGHISSSCPNKHMLVGKPKTVETSLSTKPTTTKVEDGVSTENKKVKRQTCYECGIPGHISSSCPNKRMVVSKPETVDTSLSSEPPDETVENSTAPKAKKKRQTCYECGVPGHISSSCPMKSSS